MFQAAMELTGEKSLLSFLNATFGSWPILDDSGWDENTFDLIDILIASKRISINQLLNVYVTTNPKDPRTSLLRVNKLKNK